jgi:L-threonylcarbamoyladenylate synthase
LENKDYKTERIVLKADAPDSWAEPIQRAVDVLRAGECVAFPTDTVYGLAADPSNAAAINAIFEAKGRPETKPLPILVSSRENVSQIVRKVPPNAVDLMDRYWPGPLTLILPANTSLPANLRAGGDTVGVRMPNHPVALALIQAFGGAVAVTSANRSGGPDPSDAAMVEESLGGRIPLILDGGPTPGSTPSTVLDLTVSPPKVLRAGPIKIEVKSEE